MSLSNSRLSYQDCFDLFEAALSDTEGVRIGFDTLDEAIFMRMRLHNARKIDRKDNIKIYPDGDPMHGRSAYDRFVIQLREDEGKIWVYLRQIVLNGVVENLGEPKEAEPELELEPKPEPKTTGVRRV